MLTCAAQLGCKEMIAIGAMPGLAAAIQMFRLLQLGLAEFWVVDYFGYKTIALSSNVTTNYCKASACMALGSKWYALGPSSMPYLLPFLRRQPITP